MKVIFLGTNGWYDTETGNTPCILIASEKFYVVLDAGNGIYKLDQYIKDEKPIHLFLTHIHLDHIEGLHVYDKFNFKQLTTIYVPQGKKEILESFFQHPIANPFSKKPSPITLLGIGLGKHLNPFPFETFEMSHTDDDYGYRFEIDNKIISYSGDTAICDNTKKLANDTDFLIHECSFTEEDKSNWGHTKPSEIASIAKETNLKKLVLTHFDASRYINPEMRKTAEEIARETFPNTIAAFDGLEITV